MPFHRFRPRLVDALRGYDRHQLFRDTGAGLTVGIVALPLAMAFAIASGVEPQHGLVTAIVAGLLISALGGSNVQIGGPAGAFIVIVFGIVEHHGFTNLLIATVMAGVMLTLMGLFRLGALVRYVPLPIIIGFTNGIAVLIALSQLRDLLGLRVENPSADFFSQIHALLTHADTWNPTALGLGLACAAGLFLWPRLVGPGGRASALIGEGRTLAIAGRVPGPIVALVTLTLASQLLGLQVETIGSRFGGIPQELPSIGLPSTDWTQLQQLLMPALTLAMLGAIESLLCARIADNLVDLPRHDPDQELVAQGVANIVTPFVGGIPATGTIARTVTNIRAGGRSPVAGIVHAFTVLLIVLLFAPLAVHVPLAVLAGILLHVAWNMGEWHEFSRLRHFSLSYRAILLGTFGLTVMVDLMVAFEIGLVLACAFFIHRMSRMFRVEPVGHAAAPAGVQVMAVYGALFFGAVTRLEAVADAVPAGVRAVILDASRLISIDTSGADALRQLQRTLGQRGVRLLLCELNEQPRSLLHRSGVDQMFGRDDLQPDLAAALAAVSHGETASGPPPPSPPSPSSQQAAGSGERPPPG